MISWKAHAKPICSIAFTPDSSGVVTASGDETVKLWDWANKSELRSWPGSQYSAPLSVSPDGRFVARGGNGATVWPIGTIVPVLESAGFTEAVDFSPDSATFVTHGNTSDTLRRWSVPTFRPLGGAWGGPRTAGNFPPGAMGFSPDGAILATTLGLSVLILRDSSTGEELGRLTPAKSTPAQVSHMAWTTDGRHLAAIYGPVLIVWDVVSRAEVCRRQPSKKHFKGLSSAPDGRLLTACNDNSLQVWSPPDWQESAAFDWKIGKLVCVAVSRDGAVAAAGSSTGKVIVWDLD